MIRFPRVLVIIDIHPPEGGESDEQAEQSGRGKGMQRLAVPSLAWCLLAVGIGVACLVSRVLRS